MKGYNISVKAYIVRDGKLLLLKRKPDNVHYAGKWDIPGGRLNGGEDILAGLKRETLEETGLSIEVLVPLNVRHFRRDDGQMIANIIFLCRANTDRVKISNEHEAYRWIDVKKTEDQPDWLAYSSRKLSKYVLGGFPL